MAIIDDYEGIARRMRELNGAGKGKSGDDAKAWRDLAEETARTYVESRRRGAVADALWRRAQRVLPRRGSA